MIPKKNCIVFLFLLQFFPLFSQNSHQFTEGLMLPIDIQYGRQALVSDELAHRLFTNDSIAPEEGTVFNTENGGVRWRSVSADSTGTFRGESVSEGYLYLSYQSNVDTTALMHIRGNSMFFINGVPRFGDPYKSGWLYTPVKLKQGRNDILVRCTRWARWQGIEANMIFPEQQVSLNTEDLTLPYVVLNKDKPKLTAAVTVINATDREQNELEIETSLEGRKLSRSLPSVPPMTIRKLPFSFDGSNINKKGRYACTLQLKNESSVLDEKQIQIPAVDTGESYNATFTSDIDGSVQYYSVTPQKGGIKEGSSLFLSVHGAGVQAINQARAYNPKDWGTLVAPTNRRPRGFNWEDWGRLDALEVLDIAKNKFQPDSQRIYLTGHSMGGHGTWYLGATYPGKWAAIAPCAGYPSLHDYGSSDGRIPEQSTSRTEDILLQASTPSKVMEMIDNYKASGIYIFHGDSDRVVPVELSRDMRERLGTFHTDFSYYEYPGGSHWFGNESVDWPPIFNYFKWHSIAPDNEVNLIDFTTPSPSISSKYWWAGVLQQQQSYHFSRLNLKRDLENKTIRGTTDNIRTLSFSLESFNKGDTVSIGLDQSQPLSYITQTESDKIYLQKQGSWMIDEKPDPREKGVNRNGSFKEPFNHRMVFVYGASGSDEETRLNYEKARYDAEAWYYRGNGSVDIMTGKEFDPEEYPDRGVILYGNASNNAAWDELLSECPIQVRRGSISAGNNLYEGNDLGAYFMWPREDSKVASVAVVSGTGATGMKATEANQYFASGSGFPDFMVFSVDMLAEGIDGIRCTGFYNNQWKIDRSNSIIK